MGGPQPAVADAVTAAPLRDLLELAGTTGPRAVAHVSATDARHAVQHAEATLRAALKDPAPVDTYQCLVATAANTVAVVGNTAAQHIGRPNAELRRELAGLLSVRQAVDEGEQTYEIQATDCQQSVRVALTTAELLRDGGNDFEVLVADLGKAAVELSALLLRADGNRATEGRTGDATQHCPSATRHTLKTLVDEINDTQTRSDGDATRRRVDPARRIAACQRLAAGVASIDWPVSTVEAVEAARSRWLQLAASELAAVRELDTCPGTPAYLRYFDSLDEVIAAGAANVLCACRLLSRPHRFRLAAAGARQVLALDHASRAYETARSGTTDAFATTQLIVLTRLIRSVAALAMIDATALRRAGYRRNQTIADPAAR